MLHSVWLEQSSSLNVFKERKLAYKHAQVSKGDFYISSVLKTNKIAFQAVIVGDLCAMAKG
jgi:hypothetical protein